MNDRRPSSAPQRYSRRAVCAGLALAPAAAIEAQAQTPPQTPPQTRPQTPPAAAPAPAPASAPPPFGFDDVAEAARRLAAAPYQPPPSKAPVLDYEGREARFRPARAFLAAPGSKFRLELHPLGAPGTTSVDVNLIIDGKPRRIPFSADLFDFDPHLSPAARASVNGFAGVRLLYPLNEPTRFDETLDFLRASYFQALARGQTRGQALRALAIGAGDSASAEEFPRFREFWIAAPQSEADNIVILALLDSPSLAGAFRMNVTPGPETTIDLSARIYARAPVDRLGLAPIDAMYFTGESGPRIVDSYRREVHEASGLSMRSGDGRWIWRPLRNPAATAATAFPDPLSGFGLIQRPRKVQDYEDLSAQYDRQPSYWIDSLVGFDKGHLQLIEMRSQSDRDRNIVAQWRPDAELGAGAALTWGMRISARTSDPNESLVGRATHTLIARPGPDLENAPARRFFIDFSGEPLTPFLDAPGSLAIAATATRGRAQASIARHPENPILRVTLDVTPKQGAAGAASVELNWLGRPVSETWTFPVEG